MKYWLLTTEYPPFYGGGIGTYSAITARMMASHGHDVTVFISDSTVRRYIISEDAGVRLVRFNPTATGCSSYLGHVATIAYEFAHIIREFITREGKPDLIESQEYLGIAYYLLQYKKLLAEWCRDVRIILTIHSPAFLYLEYNEVNLYSYPVYWICEMEKFCLGAADSLLTPSQYIVDEIRKRFSLDGLKVDLIRNPFDTAALNIPASAGAGNTNGEIIFFGKLSPQKGTFHLLKYFAALWEKGFDRQLVLIGGQDIVYHPDGLMMGDVVRRRYKGFIEKSLLKLEGPVKPADLGSRLSDAAVVIVPSYHDNLPYVVFEMMALGQVVLVSKQGGHSEIVHDGINGFIFDHTVPSSFEQKLMEILSLTEGQRRLISEQAVEDVKKLYSPEKIYQQKLSLISGDRETTEEAKFPFVNEQAPAKPTPFVDSVKGLLSIVVPYYNMGKYLAQTISSVIATAYNDYEIIIVNDGSSDKQSLQVLDKYRNVEKIRVIDRVNGGLASSRNEGAANARGEFLAFLDADDMVSPDYYNWAVTVLAAYRNVHFVGAWVQYFEGSDKVWPTFTPEPPLILYHNTVNSSGLVYKRASFLAAGINDERMQYPGLEDYQSVVSLVEAAYHGVVLPETKFQYRVRKDSMIRGVSDLKKLNLTNAIAASHHAFYAKFAVELFSLQNANGPGIHLDNPSLDHPVSTHLPFGIRVPGRLIRIIKTNTFLKPIAYRLYKWVRK